MSSDSNDIFNPNLFFSIIALVAFTLFGVALSLIAVFRGTPDGSNLDVVVTAVVGISIAMAIIIPCIVEWTSSLGGAKSISTAAIITGGLIGCVLGVIVGVGVGSMVSAVKTAGVSEQTFLMYAWGCMIISWVALAISVVHTLNSKILPLMKPSKA